jgi:hypothetical protein
MALVNHNWETADIAWQDANVSWTDLTYHTRGAISDISIRTDEVTADAFEDILSFGSAIGYSEFQTFIPGDYTYQEALMRTRFEALSSDRPRLTSLKLTVDVPDVNDRGFQTITASITTISFNKSFVEPPEVLAVQKGGLEIGTAVVSNVTTAGFDVKIAKSDGTLIGGDLSWGASGY